MNTKEALQQGNFDITNWLDEKKLGKTLDIIFPDEIFIHDKAVPNSGTRKRPDYRCDNLKLIVEFDGSQHFYKSRTMYNTERVKKHDEIKNKYCEDNNIKLLRIPYWWLRTDRILKELNKFVLNK